MKSATMIPTNASLLELASLLERDGAAAFDRLEEFQRRDIIERLATTDDVETLEEFETLAGEALELAADNLAERLQRCEENARAYLKSQDNLGNYWECILSELTLNGDAIRERLAEFLEDNITPDEFESLAGEIAAGMHDGVAPGCPAPADNTGPYDNAGPFGASYDIWERKDALITLSDSGDWEAFPVDDETERRLSELLDLFNRLEAIGETPTREFWGLFGVTVQDGSEYGIDGFCVMVYRPQQINYYIDVVGVAESLEEYRAARLEEQREALRALRLEDEKAQADWPLDWIEFLAGYRSALLWSTNDEYNGEEFETLEEFDFSAQGLEKTRGDCLEFIRRGAGALELIANGAVGYSWNSAGYDFWMTRAGHGVGFWDRKEIEAFAGQVDYLCSLCEEFGEQWPYIGEDDNGDAVVFVR